MPPAARAKPASTDLPDRRPLQAGSRSSLAKAAQTAAAESKAVQRMVEILEELLDIHSEFPWLIDSFVADLAEVAGDGLWSVVAGPGKQDEGNEEDEAVSEVRLINPDRIAVFFLERSNAPATPNEIHEATGIPLSSVKNVFYVKAAKSRFVKEEKDGRQQWRLADAVAEAERVRNRDDADER